MQFKLPPKGNRQNSAKIGYDRARLFAVLSPGKQMYRLALALLILALAPPMAVASQQGVVVTKNWKAMDRCALQAQAAFPDFTPDSNAKRDASLKECLAGQNLPPREPLSPSR